MKLYLVETMEEVLKTSLAGPLPTAPPPTTGPLGDQPVGTRH
jgi:hypothetical protein